MGMGQFGNPVKANHASNLIPRHQLGHAAGCPVLAFYKGSGVNIEGEERIF